MNTAVETLTVRDIATTDVVTVSPDIGLRDAIELLDKHHITGAPVVSGQQVVGVFSMMDVLAFEAATPGTPQAREDAGEGERPREWSIGEDPDAEGPPSAYFTDYWDDAGADIVARISATDGPEWDFLSEHVVSEAMTLGVRGVQADASLTETAAYMLDHAIHRVLVLSGRKLVGVVTTTDFLRALAGRVG